MQELSLQNLHIPIIFRTFASNSGIMAAPKTIYIFDLGGVLINLDVSRCMRAFEVLMGEENMRSVLGMDSNGEGRKASADSRTTSNVAAVSIATKQLMADFEQGLISPDDFIREVIRYCRPGTTKKEVVDAWMSMLGDLPEERLDFVDSLRAQGHPVYLLSNGNDLHFDYINHTYGLDRHFVRLFLSQKMHLSKPDAAIFEAVDKQVREDNPEPEASIIFIDDIEANRRAAEQAAGWQTFESINDCIFASKHTKSI